MPTATNPTPMNRPRVRTLTRLAVVAALLLAPGIAAAQSLASSVQRVIDTADIGEARVGICIREVGAASPLVYLDAESGYIPASNMKLLTSGAALRVLGPDFVFRTEIALDGSRVIVRGDGDPALADPEVLRNTEPRMTVQDFLETLASAVGERSPDGCDEIIIDDRVFDREYVHPSWDPDDLNKWYAPQVAGLNFHGNLLAIFASPSSGGAGAPPRLSTQPASAWITLENRARTVSQNRNTYWASRLPTSNTFRVFGDVRSTAPLPLNVPTHDNPLLFGHLLTERLMSKGIAVGGSSRPGLKPPVAVREVALDESLPNGELCAVVTTPLQEVINRCNTDSINLYAEALLKRIGHEITREPGSWTNGASVLRMTIQEELGPDAAVSTIIADGSGLSHSNLVTPRTLVDWIESFATDPELRDPFLLSLATPGRGTFTRRFRDADLANHVAGKSGVLTGVRTLSGIVIAPGGREIVFSILINDISSAKGPNGTKLAEQIVEEIDSYLAKLSSTTQFGG